jgi:hypothetical protein
MEVFMSDHRSLTDLDLKELKAAAAYFGTSLEGIRGKLNIVQALEDDGIDVIMYNDWQNRLKAEAPVENHDAGHFEPGKPEAKADAGPTVVVKMDRKNAEYDSFGFTFTREHPYAIVPEEVAQQILENEEGFRIALSKELEDYYS